MDSLNHHEPDTSGKQHHWSDEIIDVPASLLPGVLSRIGRQVQREQQGSSNREQRRTIPELIEALHNAAWYVRVDAIQQLGRFAEQAPLEPLLEALQDEHVSVRAAAVYALGKLGSRAPIATLVRALQDEEWQVRERAVLALSEQEVRAATEIVQTALYDPDSNVRDMVRHTLQSIPTAPLQRSWEEDTSKPTRQDMQPGMLSGATEHANKNSPLTAIFSRFTQTQNSKRSPMFSTGGSSMLDPQQIGYPYQVARPTSGTKKFGANILAGAFTAVAIITVLLFSVLAVQHLQVQNIPTSVSHPTSQAASGGAPAGSTSQIPSGDQGQHKPGDTLYTYADPFHTVFSVAWSPDDKRIVLADGGSVTSMDALTGAHKLTYISNPDNRPGSIHTSVSWSPDGTRIAGSSSRLYVWDAATGQPIVSYQPPILSNSPHHSNTYSIVSTTWSPDSKLIAFATADSPFGLNVYVWNPQTQQLVFRHILNSVSASNGDVSWSPDGRYLAFMNALNVQIWDINQNRLVEQFPAALFAWSPDSSRIFAIYPRNPGVVFIWDIASSKDLTHFQVVDMSNGPWSIGPIVWSPNGKRLLVVSNDIGEWDIATQTNLLHYTGHAFTGASFPFDAVWSHSGRLVASAAGGEIGRATMKIWVPVE